VTRVRLHWKIWLEWSWVFKTKVFEVFKIINHTWLEWSYKFGLSFFELSLRFQGGRYTSNTSTAPKRHKIQKKNRTVIYVQNWNRWLLMFRHCDYGLRTGIPVSGIPGKWWFFRLPVSRFCKQKFPVISSMVMLRHEVKNVLWKFIFGPRAK